MAIASLKDHGKNQTIQKVGSEIPDFENEVFVIDVRKDELNLYKKISMKIEGKEKETFENSKPKNKKSSQFMKSYQNYCKNFGTIMKKGLGIAMSGNAGTGKTYYSSCIENELKNKYKV